MKCSLLKDQRSCGFCSHPVLFSRSLDQQTQESRLQQLLLLQHLKRSRQKRLILLQITLRKTRCVRRAWSWPRNQFWLETLLNGYFIEAWWKEDFRISRRTFECIVRLVGRNLVSKTWSNETCAIPTAQDVKFYATASGCICHPNFKTELLQLTHCFEWCLPEYQLAFTHAKYLPR